MHNRIQSVVSELVEHSHWRLLPAVDLIDEVKNEIASSQPLDEAKIKVHSIRIYCRIALYPACYGTLGKTKQQRGFQELSIYLHRVAYSRWPQIAETVTQRALVEIFEKVKDCRVPAAFLIFSKQKLRDQAKIVLRVGAKEQSLDEMIERSIHGEYPVDDGLGDVEEASLEEETLHKELRRKIVVRMKTIRQQNPRAHRQIDAVFLRYLGYLHTDEIAQRLETHPDNVLLLIHRGLAKLRQDEELLVLTSEMLGQENSEDLQVF